MATTQMTKKLVDELRDDISRLLGRGRRAFPCPLGPFDLANLWHNMLPPDTVLAYTKLKDQGFDVRTLCTWDLEFRTELHGSQYEVRFVYRAGGDSHIFLKPPFDAATSPGAYNKNTYYRSELDIQRTFSSGVKHQEFAQWMENIAIIERDFPVAMDTLREIFAFIGGHMEDTGGRRDTWVNKGTVGQLVRAIPDLYKYLPRDRQVLLSEQSRSSNMPYEWAAFDRSRIDHLQTMMAKASLMPKQNSKWEEIQETGAKFV